MMLTGNALGSDCLGFTGSNSAQPIADRDNDGVSDDADLCIGSVPGQIEIDAQNGCPTKFSPEAELKFDPSDAKHARWYRHFWDAKCTGLGIFSGCVSGYPWEKLSDELSAGADRDLLRAQLWSAGRYIGFEWARDNSIRRIDTAKATSWGNKLRSLAENDAPTADRYAAIELMCSEAEALMK